MSAMYGAPTRQRVPASTPPTCVTAPGSASGGIRRSGRSAWTTASSWIPGRVRASETSTSPWVPHSRRGGQEAMRGRKLLNAAVMVGAGVVVGMWMGAPAISAQSGTGTRVAIIDVQRVLARSAAGVAAREGPPGPGRTRPEGRQGQGLYDDSRAAALGRALRGAGIGRDRRRAEGLRRRNQEGQEIGERRRLVHARSARRG